MRAVFIIDPAKKIRLTMTYPMSVGANVRRDLGWIRQSSAGRPPCTIGDDRPTGARADKVNHPHSITT